MLPHPTYQQASAHEALLLCSSETGQVYHRDVTGAPTLCTTGIIPGVELLESVHPAFRSSAREVLRTGGKCQVIALDAYGGSYAVMLDVTLRDALDREVRVTNVQRVTDASKVGTSMENPSFGNSVTPDGTRIRVVVLLMTNTERLIVQYTPEKIHTALNDEVAAARAAAGAGVSVSTGGLGGIVFAGRFDDGGFASRIRDAISSRRPGEPHVEFAVGEATGRRPGVVENAVRAAGYAAGLPDRYWFAEATEADRFQRQRQLRDELHELLRSGEIRLDLQPVMDSRSGRMVSAEALLRLEHRVFGPVNPDELLGAVSGSVQQIELDRWVVAEGARAARRLQAISSGFRVDVNVTASLLSSSGLVEYVGKHSAGLPDGTFGVEISERDSFARLDAATSKLVALRQIGVGVSLDDFGTGASSLACVALPFDTIKIDRCFVQRVELDTASRGVCMAVAAIGGTVDARVIAEGVETEAQIRYLNELGVTHHQGWWYAKAMRIEDLAVRLSDQ